MKIGLPLGLLVAAIAWIVLYVIIGIELWVAFVVAGGIVLLSLAGGGASKAAS
jgi:hypothetical protein